MDWINLVQDRNKWKYIVNKVMNLWSFIKFGRILEQLCPKSESEGSQWRQRLKYGHVSLGTRNQE
jgi:hypothetical protein